MNKARLMLLLVMPIAAFSEAPWRAKNVAEVLLHKLTALRRSREYAHLLS